MFFHYTTSRIAITDAGHSFTHFAHPTHASKLIFAAIPFQTSMAFRGHTFTQHPHATQSASFTKALRFFFIFASMIILQKSFFRIYHGAGMKFCDEITF
jgi:hypothetical protein